MDAVQLAVLNALAAAKEDKPPKEPAADAPLAPLPSDFIQQLAGKLTLQRTLDNIALIQCAVSYPRAGRDFPLLLQMTDTAEFGWRVTKVVNALELAQAFKAAEASLKLQQEAAFAEKNADQQLRMDKQFPISSCTVSAGRLSDRRTALMVIEVMGRNAGPSSIHNANLVVTVTDAAQQPLFTRHLNVARRSLPGEQFNHTWTVELDPSDAASARLLGAKRLQCAVRLWALALGSGEVLHIRDKRPESSSK